ncbi:MAG: hypothetical protein QXQ64_02575 [Candidatus Bathyarchaeia archaeon]
MKEVYFIDTTFRDGHASLWAEGMTTGMMLPVAEYMERAGFLGMELIATSHFLKCVRELKEDPWERIRLVAKRITKTPLRLMMHISVTAFDLTPYSVLALWMKRIAANGIKEVQLMEASNDFSYRLPECIKFAKQAGLNVVLAIIYSISPRHTDDYYIQKTKDAVALGVDSIYLKDPAGLLTPDRVRTLVPSILRNSEGIPVELHSHCTTGLAPIVYLEAVKFGISRLHTALPPLSDGSSLPSIFDVSKNLRHMGYSPVIEEKELEPVTKHFLYIAKREKLPLGAPVRYDYYQYEHQIPGGVISNLRHQLSGLKMLDRFDEVVKEIIKVRKDLGYPIMVTPFSQFIVSQATINVMMGERYRQVTDEIIKYVLGFWGQEASNYVDPDLRAHVLRLPRAKELSRWQIPEPSIDEIRKSMGTEEISDDELLLRYIVPESEVKKMRELGRPIQEYITYSNPLVALVKELCKKKDLTSVYIQKGNIRLELRK